MDDVLGTLTTWVRSQNAVVALTTCIRPRRLYPTDLRQKALCAAFNVMAEPQPPTYGDAAEVAHYTLDVDVYGDDAPSVGELADALVAVMNGAKALPEGIAGIWLTGDAGTSFQDDSYRFRHHLTFRVAVK